MLTDNELIAVKTYIQANIANFSSVATPNGAKFDVSVQRVADELNKVTGVTITRDRVTQSEMLAAIDMGSLSPQQTTNLSTLTTATPGGVPNSLFANFKSVAPANSAAIDAITSKPETILESVVGRYVGDIRGTDPGLAKIVHEIWPPYVAPEVVI